MHCHYWMALFVFSMARQSYKLANTIQYSEQHFSIFIMDMYLLWSSLQSNMYIWYSVDKLVFPHCRGDIRYCCYRHWAAGSTLSPPPHFLLLFLHTLTVYCFYHKWCVPNSSTKCMLLTYITHTGLHFTSVLDISEKKWRVYISSTEHTLSMTSLLSLKQIDIQFIFYIT